MAVTVSVTLPAQTMTIHTIEMTCLYDGTKFKFEAQGSGTAFDKALDGMLMGAIQSPWPLAVCPTNGFVFLRDGYDAGELERLRPLILSAEYQALKDETPYYRAAWIMERSAAPRTEVSMLLLQATWEVGQSELRSRYGARLATQQINNPESSGKPGQQEELFKAILAQGTTSDRYKRYASELLTRLKADVATSPDEAIRTDHNLLIGELLRRLGRFVEAENHIAVVATDFQPGSNAAKLAEFQRELVAKRDIGIHMMSKALRRPRQ
jgi:hypothetical protein